MPTSSDFLPDLAPVLSLHVSTLDRFFRPLRAANLIAKSPPGGGKSAVHLDQWDMATLLTALFADGPGGAVEAVRVVKTLRRAGALGSPMPGSDSLWGDLASAIGVAALKLQRHPDHEPFAQAREAGWELTVCLDPPEASITWTENGERRRIDYERTLLPSAQKWLKRRTTITAQVLAVCARCCVGHLNAAARRYSGLKNTASTNDIAAAPARAAAARLDQPGPIKMGTKHFHPIEADVPPQDRAGHSRTKERSDRHARRTNSPGSSRP